MITKAEVYSSLIKIQKNTGQGLSGIVKVLGGEAHLFRKYLDELIEEGLVECFNSGGSMGHPESNRWYMPTSGYNVWKDGVENGHGGRFSESSFLGYVRYYLGALSHDEEQEYEDEQDRITKRWLNPSAQALTQDPGFIKKYSEWLERNHEELEVMKNLSEIYVGASPLDSLIDGDIEWLFSREWYEENLLVSECIKKSEDRVKLDEEQLDLTKKIVDLMEGDGKYSEQLEKYNSDIAELNNDIDRRKRINNLLYSLSDSNKIQDELGSLI